MSLLQVSTYMQSLSRQVTFQLLLPNDMPPEMIQGNKHYERPLKTLYLLHGFSGNHMDWLTGSQIQELSIAYNLAVVMPAGENSFYLNGKGIGSAYETFVGEELMDYCHKTFGLSDQPEDNFIGGLSMGGFGAIHTGLKYPQRFSKMFGLSSAMIVHNIEKMEPGTSDAIADYDYYVKTFGTLNQLENSENNPEYLIRKRKNAGETIQPIYMACGTEDFLLQENRTFRDFLVGEGIHLTYQESSGIHNWKFWNEYLEPAIVWLLEKA